MGARDWGVIRLTPAAAVGCPCRGCEDRSAECHSSCPLYAAYRAAADGANGLARAEEARRRLGFGRGRG